MLKMLCQDIPDVTHHARPIFSAGLARAGVDLIIEVEGGGVEIVYVAVVCVVVVIVIVVVEVAVLKALVGGPVNAPVV